MFEMTVTNHPQNMTAPVFNESRTFLTNSLSTHNMTEHYQ